jgi:hypothetical protein
MFIPEEGEIACDYNGCESLVSGGGWQILLIIVMIVLLAKGHHHFGAAQVAFSDVDLTLILFNDFGGD